MLEEIKELLEAKNYPALRSRLEVLEPVDIAALLDDLSMEQILPLFRILPKAIAADTFVELDTDHQEKLIHSFNDAELKAVLDELFLGDTIDIIEEMPANVVGRILRHSDMETRKNINDLLN